jgi:accessory gene regulator B
METLAKKMAQSIGKSLGKTEEEIAVIAYGLIGILQFSTIFVLSSIIGLIFGFWLETAIVFLSVGFLRRLTGGAHSSGIYSCLVYSVFFVCGISAISYYLLAQLAWQINLGLLVAVFLFGYVTVALKAPVTPPNKPCRSEQKRKRLRRGSFIVLTLFLAASLVCVVLGWKWNARCYSIGLSLVLSTLWQITMMTAVGKGFVELIDGLFAPKS